MRSRSLTFIAVTLLVAFAGSTFGNPSVLTHRRKAFLTSGAGFTPVFSDNFDAATDAVALGSQTGWAAVQNTILVVNPGSAGYIKPASSLAVACARVTAAHSADQYAQITISDATTPAGSALGVAVRCQSGAVTFYNAFWFGGGVNILELSSVVAGSSVSLASTAKTYSSGVKLRLRATGAGTDTRLNLEEDTGSGWVAVFSDINPAADIDDGTPGVVSYDSDPDHHADDFVGGNVT